MAKNNVNVEATENNEVLATVDSVTTIERNEVTYKVDGITLAKGTSEKDKKVFAKAMSEVNDAMTGVTKSTVRLAKAFWYIENNELYRYGVNADGKPYRTTAAMIKDRYGLGQTLVSNTISMYDTFFAKADDRSKGIVINGHHAIEFGQTALIEMLPAMAKEDERTAVLDEVLPSMKVAEVKNVVGKHHVKNERKVKSAKKDTTEPKTLTFSDVCEACLHVVLNVDTDNFEENELKAFKKFKIDLTGMYRSICPEDAEAFFQVAEN